MSFEFKREVIHPDDGGILSKFDQMKDYYKVKHDICAEIKPKIIAEIGVRAGYSAWSFLQAAPDAWYFGFDANNGRHGGAGVKEHDWWGWAHKILDPYKPRLIELDTQGSTGLGKYFGNVKVDLFHVDGDHTEKGVQHDLDLAWAMLSPTGTILVDDMTYIAGVARGVEQWFANNPDVAQGEYRKSLRGEILITRRAQ